MIKRLQQTGALAGLTAVEMMRQPATLLITLSSVTFAALLPILITHTLGEPGKLVRDSALALQFSVGLLLGAYCACATFSAELRSGTAGSILSKPISRERFFLAKFLGVSLILVLYQLAAGITTLLASRASHQAFSVDLYAQGPLLLAIALALLLGGGLNFFLKKPFSSSAFLSLLLLLAGAFLLSGFWAPDGSLGRFGADVHWAILPVIVLITIATVALAAISVALATRLELISTLSICLVVFSAGLVSDYLFGRGAADSVWKATVYAVLPNWQHFWVVDALSGSGTIPWTYVGQTAIYASLYTGAILLLGCASFRSMDVSR